MELKCLKNSDVLATKKVAFKYLTVNFSKDDLQGELRVVGYRHYNWGAQEIDIEFKGKFLVKTRGKNVWVDLETWQNPRYSRIRMNRILRKKIFDTLKHRARLFSIKLEHYSSIKKIKWI
jgi:hypothetical protein